MAGMLRGMLPVGRSASVAGPSAPAAALTKARIAVETAMLAAMRNPPRRG